MSTRSTHRADTRRAGGFDASGSAPPADSDFGDLVEASILAMTAKNSRLDVRVLRSYFRALAASERLSTRRRTVFIMQLANEGFTQTQIAAGAEVSQAQVSRILRSARDEILHETPSDVIAAREAGEITDEQMVQRLVNMQYTYDTFYDEGDVTADAMVAGTWREVERAYQQDRLTDEEFKAIFNAYRDELIEAARH